MILQTVYIANFFGIVAIALYMLSYQLRKRKGIMVCNAISRFFYVLQYILLGAWSGAITDFLAFLVIFVIGNQKLEKKRIARMSILLVQYIIIIVSSILVTKTYICVFSILGVTFELVPMFFKKENQIRAVSLIAQPFWFTYNCYYLAWSSALGDVIVAVSIVLAIVRYRDMKHAQKSGAV